MKLEHIREQIRTAKHLYYGWLSDITPEQGTLLLAFVRDAFDKENGRGDILDQKGNWILAASLAGLAGITATAKSFLGGLQGWAYSFTVAALIAVVFTLMLAGMFVIWGMRVRAAWGPPNPELILRPEILNAEYRYLQRDLILHYTENFMSNRRVSDGKAAMLQRGQWSLLTAFALTVLIGIGRLFLPTS